MKKTKAFTLSEVLVVMIISTIVISLAFTVVTMIRKQVQLIQGNLSLKQEVKQLENILWHDFTLFGYANYSQEMFVFSKEKDTVRYRIRDGVIMRNKDTFKIPIQKEVLFLDGRITKTGYIDAIKLQLQEPHEETSIFIYGTKDASFYMNQ